MAKTKHGKDIKLKEQYFPQEIEKKWSTKWGVNETFLTSDDSDKPKYYALSMFSYPSGRLHMGHARCRTKTLILYDRGSYGGGMLLRIILHSGRLVRTYAL